MTIPYNVFRLSRLLDIPDKELQDDIAAAFDHQDADLARLRAENERLRQDCVSLRTILFDSRKVRDLPRDVRDIIMEQAAKVVAETPPGQLESDNATLRARVGELEKALQEAQRFFDGEGVETLRPSTCDECGDEVYWDSDEPALCRGCLVVTVNAALDKP